MSTREIVEIIVAALMPLGLVAIMWHRIATGMGLGVRVIQLLGVVLGLPAIVVLGLENVLEGQTVAALIAGILGYLLSGISQFDTDGERNKKQ